MKYMPMKGMHAHRNPRQPGRPAPKDSALCTVRMDNIKMILAKKTVETNQHNQAPSRADIEVRKVRTELRPSRAAMGTGVANLAKFSDTDVANSDTDSERWKS